MNERKLKQLNMLTIIMAASAVFLIFVLAFGFKPEKQNKLKTGDLDSFNEGWVLRNYGGNEDKLITLPSKIKAHKEDVIMLMHRVPEDVNKNSVLVLNTEFQNIQAYVGDKLVYENGVLNNQKLMRNAVPCINVIPLEEANPGDVVSVYMASGYDRYSGRLGTAYYGTSGDVTSWLVRQHGLGFILSAVLLVIAILLSLMLIFMKNINVDKRKAGFGFGFIFAAALWSMLDNPIMQMITANMFGAYMAAMILLLIMPVLYMMYQRCFALKRRFAKIFEIAIYIYGVNFLTGIVFQLLGVCDFATYIVFTKVLIIVGLILLSGILYLAADTFADKNIRGNLRANVILTLGCIFEVIFSLFKFYKVYDGAIMQVSIYIFMILLVITIEKSVIYEMNQTKKQEIEVIEQEKDMLIKNVNTKLIISALAQAATNLKANNMSEGKLIYDTSVYMKSNLNAATQKKLVPFDKELEYIRAYLGIQSKRYPNLDVTVEGRVTDFMVSYNTIEPIVENSIENGALHAASGNGRFVIRSYERLDCYAIQLVDNGMGISPEKQFYGNVEFGAIRKKLKTECHAGIEIKCKPGKGSIITVKIPKDGYIIKEDSEG